jgi:hypothetical protein
MNTFFQFILRLMYENRQQRYRIRTGRVPCGCQVRRLLLINSEFEMGHP